MPESPASEFLKEVAPLIVDLAAIHRDPLLRPTPANLPDIEMIAAAMRFIPHRGQIGVDCSDGARMLPKASELWVMAVTASAASQYCSSQEAFSPERHKPFCVEVRRIQRPESHKTLYTRLNLRRDAFTFTK